MLFWKSGFGFWFYLGWSLVVVAVVVFLYISDTLLELHFWLNRWGASLLDGVQRDSTSSTQTT